MSNTSGFYKNVNSLVLYAPTAVYTPTYTILARDHTNYQLPMDGWYWFNTKEEAYTYFNIIIEETEEPQNNKPDRMK